MWSKPIFYEGENEAELEARFVQLCVTYPHFDHLTLVKQLFSERKLLDANWRAEVTAKYWSNQIVILERIRLARETGGKSADEGIASREYRLAQLCAMTVDVSLPPKVRLEAHELIAKMQGEITKQVDVSNKNTAPSFSGYRLTIVDDPAVLAREQS